MRYYPLLLVLAVLLSSRLALCLETKKCIVPDVVGTIVKRLMRVGQIGVWKTVVAPLQEVEKNDQTHFVSCTQGYRLLNTSEKEIQIHCKNGAWEPPGPWCIEVGRCGALQDIPNGSVLHCGTVCGSVAAFSCDRGFKLVGNKTRTCGAGGRWTGESPHCEEIWCPEEMLVQFTETGGIVVVGETPVVGRQRNGTTVRYICPPNTVLVGSDISICQENGVWLFEPPTCKLVGCGALQDIANGRVWHSGTVFGSVAAFSCDRGFKLAGDKTRTCGADGRWTGESPHCEVVECGRLQGISNGVVVVQGTVFDSKADCSCNPGFKLVGHNSRTCDADGRWTGKRPHCEEILCPGEKLVQFYERGGIVMVNEEPVFGPQRNGTMVRYTCPPNTDLIGSNISICQENGVWLFEAPTCKLVGCAALQDIANGRVWHSGTVFGSVAAFSCDRGFKLAGDKTRTCGTDGQWTGESPHCEVVECGRLEGIANGVVVVPGTVFGSKADYSCNPGFKLIGDNSRTCDADGQWTGERPHCEVVGCGALEDIANGNIRHSGTVLGSVAAFSCDRGFKLVGNETRTCGADGRWTGESPHCEEIWCPEEMLVQFTERGGIVMVGETPAVERQRRGTKVRYICPQNTHLIGSDISICQENGVWLFEPPTCKLLECGVLENIANGSVRHSGTVIGSVAAFSCDRGFKLVGNKRRTCGADGRWTGESPHCEVVECRRPNFIANGVVVVPGTVFGSKADYSCNPGFKLIGDNSRTCDADGKWTGECPHCEVSRDCSLEQFFDVAPLGLVINANTSYVRQNTTLQVFCDGPDLTLVASGNSVTCLEDGSWDIPSHMKCIQGCENFDTRPGGLRVEGRKNSYDLGDSVTLSCIQNGMELQPHIERIACLGPRWSEDVLPICVPVEDK